MSSFGTKANVPLRENPSQSQLLDPNMLRLKNFLEKDSLISPPKYGKTTNLGEKPCDLVRSILKSRSSTQLHGAPSFQERRSIHLQSSPDIVSQDVFSQINKNSLNGKKTLSKIEDEGGENQSRKKTDFPFYLNYTYDSVILNPPLSKQADAILKYLNKKNKPNLSSQLLKMKWIDDFKLTKSFPDKIQDDEQSLALIKSFHSLKLEKEMQIVFGEGQSRRLRPGEEATIIETIECLILGILQSDQVPQLSFAVYKSKVLDIAGLRRLQNYPFCLKQVELHLKVMLTKFRCSPEYKLNEKKLKKFMTWAEAKNWLIDLTIPNELSLYLLENHVFVEKNFRKGASFD